MTLKKFVKAFVSGMAFPAVFLPLIYTVLFFMKHHTMHVYPLQFIPMYIPLVFGITNVLYVRMSEGMPASNANVSLWTVGACLGFIVAVLGVFVLHVPTLIFGALHKFQYAPLVILPIIYGLVFRYIVKWLNKTISV